MTATDLFPHPYRVVSPDSALDALYDGWHDDEFGSTQDAIGHWFRDGLTVVHTDSFGFVTAWLFETVEGAECLFDRVSNSDGAAA